MGKLITILAILLGVSMLALGYAIGFAVSEKAEKETNTTPVILNTVEYNDSAIKAEIAKVQATLDKEDLWEAEAIKLAEAENTNKHLYNALIDLNVTDLDDKDDISRIFVKDSTVVGDADEKDADVEQEVRVYYENSNGDDVRVTLTIYTEIIDGEVEEVEYELA